MGKYSLDGTTRRIAGGSGLVAGAVAVFWLVHSLHGHIPAGASSVADSSIYFFSLAAVFFALAGGRRELSEITTKFPFVSALLSLGWALGLAVKLYAHGEPDLGRAGIVTFAVAVGLIGSASRIQMRRRPEAAPPAVAADGAAARR